MPSQVTVTSTTGPGVAVTGKVFQNLKALHLDFVKGIMTIESTDKPPVDVSLTAITTLTNTITNGNHVLVVS